MNDALKTMALQSGSRIGNYEILDRIGAGGMGEVYKGLDTKLGRDVAIKVLPTAFAKDKERLARFEREARIVAQLNHPNIAAIYGLEERDSVNFLVLEYVPGETLADRIARGALTLEEALDLFEQITKALEAAHEKGIVHRDLKPSNIMITPEGVVKILDFGLAKAFREEAPVTVQSESPTLTREGPPSPSLRRTGTRSGVIMGTAPYMSPEQARGKTVDKRTDIWAFGCCLYESLAGKRVFLGETVSDTIAGILKQEPDWQALPSETPASVRSLLRRSLAKDLNHRLQHIGDARIEIEEVIAQPSTPFRSGVHLPRRGGARTVAVSSFVAAIVSGVLVWFLTRPAVPPPQTLKRLAIHLAPDERLERGGAGRFHALSPDGAHLVYCANRGGVVQMYHRPMDQTEATPIRGTDGAHDPFFSPDGQWIGFFAGGKLKKVFLGEEVPITLCDVAGAEPHGGSWGTEGRIVFATDAEGLQLVSAAGGTPKVLAKRDSENGYRWPEFLPNRKAVLFTLWRGSVEKASIAVLSLDTGEQKILVEQGTSPHYSPTGHLVFSRSESLFATTFDIKRLDVIGEPTPLVEKTLVFAGGAANYSLSREGTLVYVFMREFSGMYKLAWVDREGNASPLPLLPMRLFNPRLSPDGSRAAFVIAEEAQESIWLYEIERDMLTRFTLGAGRTPLWSPDGEWLVFSGERAGDTDIFKKPADFSGEAEPLLVKEHTQHPLSFSPDGKTLLYEESHPETGPDIWALPFDGKGSPQAVLQTTSSETAAVLSPDGKWMAYVSDESGRDEVYVRPYPGPGRRWQVSNAGGSQPLWSKDGGELFYASGSSYISYSGLFVVDVKKEPEFAAGTPLELFEDTYYGGWHRSLPKYDISPDGGRFLMVVPAGDEGVSDHMNVVLNWHQELKRLVPTEN